MAENQEKAPGQSQPQQAPQAPPKGVPGVAPPPRPPANEAEIIAAQQAEVARQIEEARKRVAQQQSAPQPQTPAQQTALHQQMIAQQQQLLQQKIEQQQQPPIPSPVPGMTAQQVAAGFTNQQGQPQLLHPMAPQGQQPQTQFAQHAPAPAPNKTVVRWHPGRNSKIQIELTDCIIVGIPDDIAGEPDPQAKVVAALFSEILSLSQRISALESQGAGGGIDPRMIGEIQTRLRGLEGVLYEQRGAMQQRARSVKEQIKMFMEQGKSPEEILAALEQQSDAAAQFVAQNQNDTENSDD